MKNNTIILLLIIGLFYLFFGAFYSALISISQIAMGNSMYASLAGAVSFVHIFGLYLGFKGINQNA